MTEVDPFQIILELFEGLSNLLESGLRSEVTVLVYLGAVSACVATIGIRSINTRRLQWHVKDHPDEPLCANCGYIIRAGSSTVCPECGRDVRIAGLVTAATGPGQRTGPWFVLASLLAMITATYVVSEVRWFPVGWTYSVMRIVCASDKPTDDDWEHRVTIQATGAGRYFAKSLEFANIYTTITNEAGGAQINHSLSFKGPELSVRLWGEAHPELVNAPFSRELFAGWFPPRSGKDQGVVPNDIATRIETAVRMISNGDFTSHEFYDRDRLQETSYRLTYSGEIMLFLSCYVLTLAMAFAILAIAFRKLDMRLSTRWHSEVERLRLTAPGTASTNAETAEIEPLEVPSP